jgi:hypothetical protein
MKKVKLQDLKCVDGLYYIGDIMDVDGNAWVEKNIALEIISMINEEL